MKRSRYYQRPKFDLAELTKLTHDEERSRLIFDWWCEDADRLAWIRQLSGGERLSSRAPRQDDPAPPITDPAPQGFREVRLLYREADIAQALTDTANFSNLPYAALGGASFLLGLDPGPGYGGHDWHAEQSALVQAALRAYTAPGLEKLATLAVEQAALTQLSADDFDLAAFAEQAALRYFGQLYGYAYSDHGLLEEASRSTYRALQYLAVGQHFVTELATLPTAQQALGRLVDRTSDLMDEYTRRARSPRRYGWEPMKDWPERVQPWSEIGLTLPLGEPLLKLLPGLKTQPPPLTLPGAPPPPPPPPDAPPPRFQLSGRDRAVVAATLLAGTLGNVQTAVCLVVQALLTQEQTQQPSPMPACDLKSLGMMSDTALLAWLTPKLPGWLAQHPPVPVLPRRTRKGDQPIVLNGGGTLPADTDCLLLLEALQGCPHVWGQAQVGTKTAPHACLGEGLARPLILALVRHTLKLRGLKSALDPLTGERLEVERLWGFAATSYPLRFDRDRVRKQSNLIVSMRVKAPVADNAPKLRRLVAAALPRIEHALTGFGGVHFAWFEFSEDETQLTLRTIYDGPLEAYLKHFALRVGDLFDGLFEYLEGAPQRPVAEHPEDFVETIRRHNRAPLAGYLYSAYPSVGASLVRDKLP